nr:PREDICTED: proline-rich protein 15-like protein A [Paralichthys olivaceus]
MTNSSSSWWQLPFLRKQTSQPKVMNVIPEEIDSNANTGQQGSGAATGAAEVSVIDSEQANRLERIIDKTTANKGCHVKVSRSGRFKEKKKVRATLAENPEMFAEVGPARNDNKKARK